MLRGSTKQTIFRFTLLACMLGMTLAAYAGNNVSVTLTGVGGAEYGYGSNYADGEYVMPYYLSINNATPVPVICDDYGHTVYLNENWTASVHTFSDLTGTRFGVADTTQYHEAAWLASQIGSSSPLSTIAAIQFAIWSLFTNGVPVVSGETGWLSSASAAASHNYYGMDFSHWEILTPNNPTSPQEYFLYVPSIPEPSAWLDMFVGLVAFAGIWTVKRRRIASARI